MASYRTVRVGDSKVSVRMENINKSETLGDVIFYIVYISILFLQGYSLLIYGVARYF